MENFPCNNPFLKRGYEQVNFVSPTRHASIEMEDEITRPKEYDSIIEDWKMFAVSISIFEKVLVKRRKKKDRNYLSTNNRRLIFSSSLILYFILFCVTGKTLSSESNKQVSTICKVYQLWTLLNSCQLIFYTNINILYFCIFIYNFLSNCCDNNSVTDEFLKSRLKHSVYETFQAWILNIVKPRNLVGTLDSAHHFLSNSPIVLLLTSENIPAKLCKIIVIISANNFFSVVL